MTHPPGADPQEQPGVRFYPAHPDPAQPLPAQPYPAQSYPAQAYPAQAYPAQAYPAPPFPAQSFPAQSYAAQAYPAQPPSGLPPPGLPRAGPGPATGRIDGFAITSLVLSLLGGGLLSIGFGIAALRRIRRTGRGGRGLAIAGIVVSVVGTLVIAGLAAAVLSGRVGRDALGNVNAPGRERVSNVRLGDCVQKWPQSGIVINLQVTPCTQPHQAEVFAVGALPAQAYPGEAAVRTQSEALCTAKAPGSIKQSEANGLSLGLLYPQSANWTAGDRKVTCVAIAKAPRTTSVRG